VLKPEHERRPGREANQHKPACGRSRRRPGIGRDQLARRACEAGRNCEDQSRPMDILLVGDSITMQWGAAWTKHFGQYETVNIGIGGDKTQNVLWRLDHGGAAGLEPRMIVLLIATTTYSSRPRRASKRPPKASKCAWRTSARSSKGTGHRGEDFPAHGREISSTKTSRRRTRPSIR